MIRGADKKEFIKTLESLCGRHTRWEIWKDMVVMFACTISNAVDKTRFEKREQLYMDTVKRYSSEEIDTFVHLFAQLVMVYERNGFGDFLGELYMELGLGNEQGGQFFTPYDVCKCMAGITMEGCECKLQSDLDTFGYISVNDPACGAGATLIAAADKFYSEMKVNYQTSVMFVAQDIDYTTALTCYIQMSLFGMPGYVKIGNTLTEPMIGDILFGGEQTDDYWYTPMYFRDVWEIRRQNAILKSVLHNFPAEIESKDAESHEDEPEPVQEHDPLHEPEQKPECPQIIQVGGKQARRKPQGQLMFDI